MRSRANLLMHELIGLEVRVQKCACRSMEGLQGTVLDETKNTLLIRTQKGERRIPKKGCLFRFELGHGGALIEGEKIAFRPHERPKKLAGKR